MPTIMMAENTHIHHQDILALFFFAFFTFFAFMIHLRISTLSKGKSRTINDNTANN